MTIPTPYFYEGQTVHYAPGGDDGMPVVGEVTHVERDQSTICVWWFNQDTESQDHSPNELLPQN